MIGGRTNRRRMLAASAAAIAFAAPMPAMAQAQTFQFNIPAQSMDAALRAFARTSRQQILFDRALVRGRRSAALTGSHSAEEGLNLLLDGSGLAATRGSRGAFVVRAMQGGVSASGEIQAGGAAADSDGVEDGATPEILVRGYRSLNADIARSEDDAQPYVVLGRDEVRRSQATTLEELLRSRLPMNTTPSTPSQSAGSLAGAASSINLRGLGANQTLILVDGRRLPSINTSGGFLQPDLNGIPLAAIERIEILPSTASGIYGGGATGGVINIITRQDYAGIDLGASYGSSFRGDATHYRFDGSAGLSLWGGATSIRISGSYSDASDLLVGDRDFVRRGRALQLRNNPAAFFSATQPPIGGTANIRSSNGSNLILDTGTPLNSPNTSIPLGYAGVLGDRGAALVARAGQYNLDLPASLSGAEQTLTITPRIASASANVRQRIGRRVELYADLSWYNNRSTTYASVGAPTSTTLAANAANNPFTTQIIVSVPAIGLYFPADIEIETLRAVGGAIVRLPLGWTASADYVWSRGRRTVSQTNPAVGDPDGTGPGLSVTNALSSGVLDVMRDVSAFPLDWRPYLLGSPNVLIGPSETTLDDANLRLAGPLVRLPAGPVTATALAGWRREGAGEVFTDSVSGTTGLFRTFYTPPRSQSVRSVYGEVRVPLFGEGNARRWLQMLEIAGSVRHENYRTRAPAPTSTQLASRDAPLPTLVYSVNEVSQTSFTLSARYTPVAGLALRASYGTGFLPPAISQINPGTPQPATTSLIDPKRQRVAATTGPYTLFQGGNPALVPETSSSWSIGAVIEPRLLPGFRLSVDYTNIRKTNEISTLNQQQILDLEDLLPGRVVRQPLSAADQAAGFTGGIISSIDVSSVNLAGTRLQAVDVQADYRFGSPRWGEFHLYAIGTWQPQLSRRTLPTQNFVDSSGFLGVLEWRANAGIAWEKGPVTIGWNADYYAPYRPYAATSLQAAIDAAILNQGSGRIPSQIYHDLFVRFRLDGQLASRATRMELMLGVQNVFDHDPPILATTGTVGGYSAYGDPRLRRFTVTLRTGF